MSIEEARDMLSQLEKEGLVHTTTNCQRRPQFICNCCTCSCLLLRGLTEFNNPRVLTKSNFKPEWSSENCNGCEVCIDICPTGALRFSESPDNLEFESEVDEVVVEEDKCIGCAECMAACRFGAVICNWGEEDEVLQKSIAEHALGVLKGKENRAAFFNFLMSVTKDCDCFNEPDMDKIVDDIGITASTDPVALDKATLDLVENKTGKKLANLIGNDKLDPRYQIEHAERIGLGSSCYELIEVN